MAEVVVQRGHALERAQGHGVGVAHLRREGRGG
jgi:hypothetical protein